MRCNGLAEDSEAKGQNARTTMAINRDEIDE